MKKWKQISLLTLCVLLLIASTPTKPAWLVKKENVPLTSSSPLGTHKGFAPKISP